MTDYLLCEECGTEFELEEAQLFEDDEGNEAIECPGCGEIYEDLMEAEFDPETAKWKILYGKGSPEKKKAALTGISAAEMLPQRASQKEKRTTFKTFYRMASGRKPPKSERPPEDVMTGKATKQEMPKETAKKRLVRYMKGKPGLTRAMQRLGRAVAKPARLKGRRS